MLGVMRSTLPRRHPTAALAALCAALCVALASGCAEPDPPPPGARIVPGAAALRLTPDPGPPPHEAPPRATLWRAGSDGWTPIDRVLAVAPGGRARVDVQGRLVVDERPVAEHALPQLAVGPDGAVVFVRQEAPPERDLWRLEPDGALRRLTTDGASDRPVFTPDGRLLHIGAVDGRARWFLDGAPLAGSAAEAPPPAWADRHRWEGDRLVYEAGDGAWWLDPRTGAAGPR